MASCGICGRQVDTNEDGLPMMAQCPCIKTPLGGFLRYAVDTCVNPRPSLEVDPSGVCPRCGANAALEGYCEECDDSERDRKLCMDQDDDKEYRLGVRRC